MIHSVLPYEFESSGSNGEIPEHIKYRTTINICFIAPLSALEVDNRSSSVPSVAQAVLRSEDDIELVTAGDVAMSTGFAMIERSPTLDPTNRRGTTQLQQLHGDDREETGCGSGYFVDSPLPSTEFVDSGKSIGDQATNAIHISDDGSRDIGCCSYTAESLTASSTVGLSPEMVDREPLTTEAAGGWKRPRGRGRGRIIALSPSVSDVSDAAVGSHWIGITPRVGGGRIG